MFSDSPAFSSFAVKDIDAARAFYGKTLGLDVRDGNQPGIIELHVAGGASIMVYPKPDHQPAVFTILNFVVPSVEKVVDELNRVGIQMERYDTMGPNAVDAKGISRGRGPTIAWFTDPSGNIIAVLETGS